MTKKLRRKRLYDTGVPLGATGTLTSLMGALGHAETQFEAMIVTDGSGSSWTHPCGSAAVMWRRNEKTKLLYDRASAGTSQYAELEAVVLAVRYLHGVKAHKTSKGCRLLIVTDSTLVETMVSTVAKNPVKLYNSSAHPDAASALLAMARRGFVFTVRRIARNSSPVHAGVDAASRAARLQEDPMAAYKSAVQKSLRKLRKNQNGEESSK